MKPPTRELLLVAVLSSIAAGCGRSAHLEPSMSAAQLATSNTFTPMAAPKGIPVLTMRVSCQATCVTSNPAGLPNVAVYEDGAIITSRVLNDQFVMLRSAVTAEQLAGMDNLAVQAGLTGGGTLPILPVPDGIDVRGGDDVEFSHRETDIITSQRIQTLGAPLSPADHSGARSAYAQLQQSLDHVGHVDQVSWTNEALLATRRPQPPAAETSRWQGPDFRSQLTNTAAGSCAIVTNLGPLRPEGMAPTDVNVQGERWSIQRRPLLPHENTCHDLDRPDAI